jgi:hypothetical protein
VNTTDHKLQSPRNAGIGVPDRERPNLGYTNRPNRSPALERRRALVRRAARHYLLLLGAAVVIVSALGVMAASYTR